MSMKTTKYKLSDMAKDLKVTNNDLIECLGKLGGEPKKTQSVLTPEEISYVLEYYTQNNQVDSFDAFYANNVKPAKEEKKADKMPVKAEKKEKKAEKKPEPKPAPKAEAKPEPKPAPKAEAKPEPKAEPKVEKKPEVKAETKHPAPEQKKKQPAPQKPAKKKEHGVRQQLGGFSDKKEASGGYTISEDNDSFGTQRTIDTRGSYIELDKYNEKYDNLANSKQNKSKDNFTKKQKLTQKSQQRKKQQFSHKKETESEKLRRLELERARKQQLKVMIPDEIVVSELASRLKVTATEVIKKLMGLGVMASINEVVDFDTAALVAEELGAKVEKEVHVTIEERLIETDEDPEESLQERCPVVVVMGHVDHGKTSILDRIRNAHVTDTEAGGITQHIGAYQVEYQGKKITFLDTPGHEAFTAMRARGANVTDIAILVVAADDGIMPQTIESINHAKAAGVSIIVAINKMDKEGADPDRVKQQLTEQSLVVEEWGGDVIAVPVSAKTGMGIDELLENILLVAEVKELKANPDRLARGTVVEARLDKGKGPVATLLVQNGTLKSGDVIIAGTSVGRIRTMTNDKGRSIKEAGPSTPVEITGLGEVPSAGDVFNAVADEKLARELVEQRKHEAKEELFQQHQKVTLDNLFSQIAEGEMKELPIIVKADVQGSVEAVKQSLEKLSNDEVRVKVIHGGVGAVSESDVMLANASNAIIVGFNVRPDPVAKQNAEQSGVDIRLYRIIYDAIEEITDAMKGMLAPKYREVETARIEVRQVYKISNVGTVAGSYVLDGKVGRNNEIRVVRDGIVIAEDKMSSLKRFKDDAKEVAAGFECGITLEKFTDIKEGDIFEAFYMEEYRD
ncbi:translation initiation factor IF-2 [Ruminococcus bicirculans]|uniref:Translation initiation factor IF-2 n=2 Tax=Ruminococcus bicirculans (ex Wegman et al. 2014) TaxID=1160721 RepID=A0AAW6E984_9FIRM|nr:translation initiation factor IF-2 [Ruminococcus bicirculans (ex Wegman et al. 2014)]MDB8744571.1 translation initiation factor IF-2 [Ruminococcus bicirculans (ex Wegman et al. 2014)]MDB8747563.1 translation initiation factor IF-2 [Ruminococcus bicirculans (ex Wegman et al. 2014)]MDB8752684.1 translation initiation factor IF-2 [Ruminococcus bicirculans (ex Wegman et al. 2014)]